MPRIPDYSDYEYDIVEELRKDHTTVTGYRPSDSEILRTSQQETYARSRTRPGAVSGALANSELSFSANHVRGPELVDAVGQESADRYVAMASAHERRAISFARDVETMLDDYNGQHSMALFLRYSPEDLQWFARQTGTTDQFAGHIETLINLRKTEAEWRRTRDEETDRILKDSVREENFWSTFRHFLSGPVGWGGAATHAYTQLASAGHRPFTTEEREEARRVAEGNIIYGPVYEQAHGVVKKMISGEDFALTSIADIFPDLDPNEAGTTTEHGLRYIDEDTQAGLISRRKSAREHFQSIEVTEALENEMINAVMARFQAGQTDGFITNSDNPLWRASAAAGTWGANMIGLLFTHLGEAADDAPLLGFGDITGTGRVLTDGFNKLLRLYDEDLGTVGTWGWAISALVETNPDAFGWVLDAAQEGENVDALTNWEDRAQVEELRKQVEVQNYGDLTALWEAMADPEHPHHETRLMYMGLGDLEQVAFLLFHDDLENADEQLLGLEEHDEALQDAWLDAARDTETGDYTLTQPVLTLLAAYGKHVPMKFATAAAIMMSDPEWNELDAQASTWENLMLGVEQADYSPAKAIGIGGTLAGLGMDLGMGIMFDPTTYLFGGTASAGRVTSASAVRRLAHGKMGRTWADDVARVVEVDKVTAHRQISWMAEHGDEARLLIMEGASAEEISAAVIRGSEQAMTAGRLNPLGTRTLLGYHANNALRRLVLVADAEGPEAAAAVIRLRAMRTPSTTTKTFHTSSPTFFDDLLDYIDTVWASDRVMANKIAEELFEARNKAQRTLNEVDLVDDAMRMMDEHLSALETDLGVWDDLNTRTVDPSLEPDMLDFTEAGSGIRGRSGPADEPVLTRALSDVREEGIPPNLNTIEGAIPKHSDLHVEIGDKVLNQLLDNIVPANTPDSEAARILLEAAEASPRIVDQAEFIASDALENFLPALDERMLSLRRQTYVGDDGQVVDLSNVGLPLDGLGVPGIPPSADDLAERAAAISDFASGRDLRLIDTDLNTVSFADPGEPFTWGRAVGLDPDSIAPEAWLLRARQAAEAGDGETVRTIVDAFYRWSLFDYADWPGVPKLNWTEDTIGRAIPKEVGSPPLPDEYLWHGVPRDGWESSFVDADGALHILSGLRLNKSNQNSLSFGANWMSADEYRLGLTQGKAFGEEGATFRIDSSYVGEAYAGQIQRYARGEYRLHPANGEVVIPAGKWEAHVPLAGYRSRAARQETLRGQVEILSSPQVSHTGFVNRLSEVMEKLEDAVEDVRQLEMFASTDQLLDATATLGRLQAEYNSYFYVAGKRLSNGASSIDEISDLIKVLEADPNALRKSFGNLDDTAESGVARSTTAPGKTPLDELKWVIHNARREQISKAVEQAATKVRAQRAAHKQAAQAKIKEFDVVHEAQKIIDRNVKELMWETKLWEKIDGLLSPAHMERVAAWEKAHARWLAGGQRGKQPTRPVIRDRPFPDGTDKDGIFVRWQELDYGIHPLVTDGSDGLTEGARRYLLEDAPTAVATAYNDLAGLPNRAANVTAPASAFDLILAQSASQQTLLNISRARAIDGTSRILSGVMKWWMFDKLFGPRTAAVVSADEMIRYYGHYGFSTAAPQHMRGAHARLNRRFNKDPSKQSKPERDFLAMVDDSMVDSTQMERSLSQDAFRGYTTLRRGGVTDDGRKVTTAEMNDAARRMIAGNLTDSGFRAWLLNPKLVDGAVPEGFLTWWNTSADAQRMMSRGAIEGGENGGRRIILSPEDVWHMYENAYPYLFDGDPGLRKALVDLAQDVELGKPARISNEVAGLVKTVRGLQNAPEGIWQKGMDTFFTNPTHRRQSLIYRTERAKEEARLLKLFNQQGKIILPDSEIAELLNIDLSQAAHLRQMAYPTIMKTTNYVPAGYVEELVARAADAAADKLLYGWNESTPIAQAGKQFAPFYGPWAEMWKYWFKSIGAKPYIRGGQRFEGLDHAASFLPGNPKPAAMISRLAATDFTIDELKSQDDENNHWSSFYLNTIFEKAGITDLDPSALFFLPVKGDKPTETLLPQPGPIPMWLMDLMIHSANTAVEIMDRADLIGQFFPAAAFGSGDAPKDLFNRFIGGGITSRAFNILDAGRRYLGPDARGTPNFIAQMTNDWVRNSMVQQQVRVDLANGGLQHILETATTPDEIELMLDTLLIGSEKEALKNDAITNQTLSWLIPVRGKSLSAALGIEEVWRDLGQSYPEFFGQGLREGASRAEKGIYADRIRNAYHDLPEWQQLLILVENPGAAANTVSGWEWTDEAAKLGTISLSPYRTGPSNEDRAQHRDYLNRDLIRVVDNFAFAWRAVDEVAFAKETLAKMLWDGTINNVNDFRWDNLVSRDTYYVLNHALNDPRFGLTELGFTDERHLWAAWGSMQDDMIIHLVNEMQKEDPNLSLTMAKEYAKNLIDDMGLKIPPAERALGMGFPSSLTDEDTNRVSDPFGVGYPLPLAYSDGRSVLPEWAERAALALGMELNEDTDMTHLWREVKNLVDSDTSFKNTSSVVTAAINAERSGRAQKAGEQVGRLRQNSNLDPELRQMVNTWVGKEAVLRRRMKDGYKASNAERLEIRDDFTKMALMAPDEADWRTLYDEGYARTYGDWDFVPPEPPPIRDEASGVWAQDVFSPSEITNVIDGDTIQVHNTSRTLNPLSRTSAPQGTFRVRIIGADSPEMGTEEGELVRQELLEAIRHGRLRGDRIYLVPDRDYTGTPRDAYGRMLAWLYIGDTPYTRGVEGFIPYK